MFSHLLILYSVILLITEFLYSCLLCLCPREREHLHCFRSCQGQGSGLAPYVECCSPLKTVSFLRVLSTLVNMLCALRPQKISAISRFGASQSRDACVVLDTRKSCYCKSPAQSFRLFLISTKTEPWRGACSSFSFFQFSFATYRKIV